MFLNNLKINRNTREINNLKEDVEALSAFTGVELPISQNLDMNSHAIDNIHYLTLKNGTNDTYSTVALDNDGDLFVNGVVIKSDEQTLSLSHNDLSITNGNTVSINNLPELNVSNQLSINGQTLKNGSQLAGWGNNYPIWNDRFALIGFDDLSSDKKVSFLGKPLTDCESISFYDNNNNGVLTAEDNILKWNGQTVAHPETSGIQNPVQESINANNQSINNILLLDMEDNATPAEETELGIQSINNVLALRNTTTGGSVWLRTDGNSLKVNSNGVYLQNVPNGCLHLESTDATGDYGLLTVSGTGSTKSLLWQNVPLATQGSGGNHSLQNVNTLTFDSGEGLSTSTTGNSVINLTFGGNTIATKSTGTFSMALSNNHINPTAIPNNDLNTFRTAGSIIANSGGEWIYSINCSFTFNQEIKLINNNVSSNVFRIQMYAVHAVADLDSVSQSGFEPYLMVDFTSPSIWHNNNYIPTAFKIETEDVLFYNYKDNVNEGYTTYKLDEVSIANRPYIVVVMQVQLPDSAVITPIYLTGNSLTFTEALHRSDSLALTETSKHLSLSSTGGKIGTEEIQTKSTQIVRAVDNTSHTIKRIKMDNNTVSRLNIDVFSTNKEYFNAKIAVHRDDTTTTIVGQRIEQLSNPASVILSFTTVDEYININISGSSENIDWKVCVDKDVLPIPDLGAQDVDDFLFWYPLQDDILDNNDEKGFTVNWTSPTFDDFGARFYDYAQDNTNGTAQIQLNPSNNSAPAHDFDMSQPWSLTLGIVVRGDFLRNIGSSTPFAGLWNGSTSKLGFGAYSTDGGLSFILKTSNIGGDIRTNIAKLEAYKQYQITVVYTPGETTSTIANNFKFYVNKVDTTPEYISSAVLIIINTTIEDGGGWVFNHGPNENISIANFRRYDRALSSQEVEQMYDYLYQTTPILPLTVWEEAFDGDLDSFTLLNGTATYEDNSAIVLTDQDNTSFRLDMSSNRISKDYPLTMSFWIKTTANPIITNYPSIFSIAGASGDYIRIGYTQASGSYYYDFSYKASSGSASGKRLSTAIVNNEWHFYTVKLTNDWAGPANSQNHEEIELFYDGVPDASAVNTATGDTYSTFNLNLATIHSAYRNDFNIRDVRFYFNALSNDEILGLYNQG